MIILRLMNFPMLSPTDALLSLITKGKCIQRSVAPTIQKFSQQMFKCYHFKIHVLRTEIWKNRTECERVCKLNGDKPRLILSDLLFVFPLWNTWPVWSSKYRKNTFTYIQITWAPIFQILLPFQVLGLTKPNLTWMTKYEASPTTQLIRL